MLRLPSALLAIVAFAAAGSHADGEILTPPPALVLENVPPIPVELAKKVAPYAEFRPHGMLSWHPGRREMLVRRRLTATNQVHLLTEPLTFPTALTDFPDAVSNAEYHPTRGDSFLFTRGEGGNEVFQVYRYDFATKETTRITSGNERASFPAWSRQGDRVVFTTQPIDRFNPDRVARTALHIMDPAKPETGKVLANLEGGGWGAFRFSEDGKKLAFQQVKSRTESYLWVMDVATGRKRRVTRETKAETVAYGPPRFANDGKAPFATSTRDSEFNRLVLLPLNGSREKVLTQHLKFDVDLFDISFDANMIAFITNDHGSGALRFIDLATLKEQPRPSLMHGVIGGLEWRRKSTEVGISISSARTAG